MTSQGERNSPRPTQGSIKISLGATIKERFRQLARSLTPREAPAPQPTLRRRRTDETRGGFKLAARQIMRRAVRIPAAAYETIAFLSDTLDWLNPWHSGDESNPGEFNESFEPIPQQHLYPHL